MAVLSVTSLLLITIVWPLVHSALTINVTPSPYNIGLTKSLKVECLFSRDSTSALTYLMSLSLSHSTNKENSEYEDLVSTNSFESQVFGNADNANDAEVYGAVNNRDDSNLRVIWKYPNASRAGGYKCDAIGLNSKRKPVTLSSTADVTAVYLDSDRLVGELRRLTGSVESQNNDTGIKNMQMKGRIQTITKLVEQNQLKFSKFSVMTKSILRSMMFIPSPLLNGRRYWLTNSQFFVNATTANNFCEYFDGYLAEIESAEEYTFVADNLLNKKLFDFVYVSGTDEEQEGVWRYHHSNNVMTFLNWGNAEPSGAGTENCLTYNTLNAFADIPCSDYNISSVGFICEITE